MSTDALVKLEKVSKSYKLYNSPNERLKEALSPFRKKYHKEFYALHDISFELKKGECLGIIGRNGTGKSTLLKLIAHIIEPTSGSVLVNGSVSALLELGTGFNPEFTGMQNIYFYGTILGFGKKEIEGKIEEIVAFADIGNFINQPVKTYSSGMFVRLAFAVQTSLKPAILLVDEVLSVGDIFFQQKCHARIDELTAAGTALILVSHDTQMIEKYSNSVMLLDNGKMLMHGAPNEVVYEYYKLEKRTKMGKDKTIYKNYTVNENSEPVLEQNITWPSSENITIPENQGESSGAICLGLALCGIDNNACGSFKIGETGYLFYEMKLLENIGFPYGVMTIINSKNMVVHAKDTLQYSVDNQPVAGYSAGTVLRFVQSFRLSLSEGEYTISIGLGHINPEEHALVKKADYIKRGEYMTGILGLVKPISFKVEPDKSALAFPFHGYVDLEGSYLLHVQNSVHS